MMAPRHELWGLMSLPPSRLADHFALARPCTKVARRAGDSGKHPTPEEIASSVEWGVVTTPSSGRTRS